MLKTNNAGNLQDDSSSVFSSDSPVLSIIVPIYNTEKYLEECLDSILNQEFSDFEVLCVDDGSTDRSSQIIDEYARLDSRIKPFHINNQGVSHARNYALDRAKGTYIGFVDGDDWIDSDHFSILMKGFDDPSVDLSVNRVVWEKRDASSRTCSKEETKDYVPKELTRGETFEAFFFDYGVRGYPVNKVFKREMIKNAFNEKITFIEDFLFCCQYAYDVKKTIYANYATYHYRISDNADSTWLFEKIDRVSGLTAQILIVELLSRDVELKKYRDAEIRSLLNTYFAFVSHYSENKNKVVTARLREYKSEIKRCLRLFWTSRHYNSIVKLELSIKYYFPRFGQLLRSFSKKLLGRRLA